MFPLSSTDCSGREMGFLEGVLSFPALHPEQQSVSFFGRHACFPLVGHVEEGIRGMPAVVRLSSNS